jgi:hypothetical protein
MAVGLDTPPSMVICKRNPIAIDLGHRRRIRAFRKQLWVMRGSGKQYQVDGVLLLRIVEVVTNRRPVTGHHRLYSRSFFVFTA